MEGKKTDSDLELAKEARKYSHAVYSNFEVGCALRGKSGKVYKGANIENHGIMSICAERTAFVKAITEGEREFEKITVVGGPKGKEPTDNCMPCGYCRQFMSEFVNPDFKIITTEREYTMKEILPYNFSLKY